MTLVADRFIRFDDGTVRDLATGERVTLIDITLTGAAEQVARRDYCLARLDAQARSGGALAQACDGMVSLETAVRDSDALPLEELVLVDFGLVGESRWIEAWRPTSEAATTRERDGSPMWTASGRPGDEGVLAGPVVGAIAATLDGLGSRDVRRLYVKAPEHSRLDVFNAIVAREVRARGFIPLSASFVDASPAIAPLLASRSIVLFGDARCVFSGFPDFSSFRGFSDFRSFGSFGSSRSFGSLGVSGPIARAVALLHRTACVIGAIVARVCDHVNVAALRLMAAPAAAIPRTTVTWRPATAVGGSVSMSESENEAEPAPQTPVGSAWAPQSVVQPAVAISYDDPSLPSLFPRTEQIAQVAETAELASFESYESEVVSESSGSDNDSDASINVGGADGTRQPVPHPASRSHYPPLRLVKRRTRSEPAERPTERGERAAIDIPVVTTMVSGYGEAADLLVGRGRWAAASRALRAALAAYERRKHRHDAARTSIALGRLHLAMGEVGPAVRCFDRAGELASKCGADATSASGAGPGGFSHESSSDGSFGHASARLIGEALRWSGVAALEDADLERSERLLRSALVAIGPEADPHQVFAIELSLARCLFWQGRFREIVLPAFDASSPGGPMSPDTSGPAPGEGDGGTSTGLAGAVLGRAVFASARGTGATSSNPHDALAIQAAVILRVERWRRVARIALVDGDLSTAGDAIARASRMARGGDEDDVRGTGHRIALPERIGASLRAACHLDAARLQFAIGDTGSGDAHLRESLALSRVPARSARVQLLQLSRFRNSRTSEGRRRFERLSAALRQPRTPKLVRIQARYLLDPRARRAPGGPGPRRSGGPLELVTFLDRHGDTALAGYGHPDRRGGSPMIEAFQDILRICHETPDDLTALARVSAWLRDQLRALSVAIYGAAADEHEDESDGRAVGGSGLATVRYAVAGSTRVLSPDLAMRAIDSGLAIPPTHRPDALDAAAPVRYGGATIGAIVVRWSIDAALDHTTASALIGAATAAVSPHLRAALDRERRPDDGHVGAVGGTGSTGSTGSTGGAGSRSSARTLGLLGISSAIETLRHTITRVSSAPFHVLIEGESGSGKELVARALHQHGPRRHRRFCAVNCAAFSDELLEAELFGHTRGAFTGALTERAGLFEEADGGTLFLDEIGELSPRGQAKLLRVIQDGETRRIGENLPRRVDTRIVAATNRSLRDEAAAGQFREDLLYRLDVIRITVPPLRDRPEDVPVLARAFWDEAIARLGSRATLDPAALTALARYHWPGNVRELHNAIMALAVHAPPRGRVTPSMLPASILAPAAPAAANGDGNGGASVGASDDARDVAEDRQTGGELLQFEGPLEDARRAFESRYIRAVLARAGGSPSRAARSLGLTRQGLTKLMTRLGIDNERRASPRRTTTARKERPPP